VRVSYAMIVLILTAASRIANGLTIQRAIDVSVLGSILIIAKEPLGDSLTHGNAVDSNMIPVVDLVTVRDAAGCEEAIARLREDGLGLVGLAEVFSPGVVELLELFRSATKRVDAVCPARNGGAIAIRGRLRIDRLSSEDAAQ